LLKLYPKCSSVCNDRSYNLELPTTCVLGGENERSWSRIRNQACFLCDVIIIYKRDL